MGGEAFAVGLAAGGVVGVVGVAGVGQSVVRFGGG